MSTPIPSPLALDPEKVAKKLRLVSELFEFAISVKAHQILLKHPELSDAEARRRAYALMEKAAER
jgi:hypothetical protein